MKLTKEECEKSLDEIYFEANNSASICGDSLEQCNEILKELIKKYFELKEIHDELVKFSDDLWCEIRELKGLGSGKYDL
jgi:hypothetical protein